LSSARRTVLRRSRSRTWTQAGARITQRRQSSSFQLLFLGAARVKNYHRVKVRENDLLSPSLTVQRTAAQRKVDYERGSLALLLFESHRLQRPMPLQSQIGR